MIEGPPRSRTRRCRLSPPPSSHDGGSAVCEEENRIKKACSVQERGGPSVCSICRLPPPLAAGSQSIKAEVKYCATTHCFFAWYSLLPRPCGADSHRFEGLAVLQLRSLTSPLCASRVSATTGRAADDGCSAKVANHRFTVVGPCYELTTLLRRTLTYALGPSSRARRELPGFLTGRTPYGL